MDEKRFVFLVVKAEDEVLHETTIEFRCKSLDDATARASQLADRWECVTKWIGVREGFKSTARFVSFVSASSLPGYIKQNERVQYVFDADAKTANAMRPHTCGTSDSHGCDGCKDDDRARALAKISEVA